VTQRAMTKGFFDPATSTITYVVRDPASRHAAIIDPVLDYDPKSGATGTASADQLLAHVREHRLQVDWILETHAHADHVSSAQYLKQQVGGRVAIGEHIRTVQATFRDIFNLEPGFRADGSQFDHLFKDGEAFSIGELKASAIHVPGHTPADIAYVIDGAVFVGDTLFMPDVGTARADFPGGDAHRLYRSIRKLLDFPPETELYMCHDYPPEGREAQWRSTVAEQRRSNVHVRDGIDEQAFVERRTARDRTLEAPVLILPSIQVNVRAGHMPPPEGNGKTYLKIPLNVLPSRALQSK
jgi:glyoxylase-like metal-dependent hydrolase (beta-lactamase superfamily II)